MGAAVFDPMEHMTPEADVRELEMLADLAPATPQGKIIVEIGSWAGTTALILASPPSVDRVFCIDHWKGNPGDQIGIIAGRLGQRHVFRTFCKNVRDQLFRRIFPLTGTSAQYAEIWPFKVSMVFIDGDHEQCDLDIHLWTPHVVSGGIIACHDYGQFPEVTRAVDEAAPLAAFGGYCLAWWNVP